MDWPLSQIDPSKHFYGLSLILHTLQYGVIYLQDKLILNFVPETFSQKGKTFVLVKKPNQKV